MSRFSWIRRGAFAAIVTALLTTGCGGAQTSAGTRVIRIASYRSVGDLARALSNEHWAGREGGCSFFFAESPRIYWDVQPVVIRWGDDDEQMLRGFVLCGDARESALRDPRVGQDVDLVFLRGELNLMSPAGPLPFDAHPIAHRGDGEAEVMLRFDPSRSDDFWAAPELLAALREAEDDVLIARWDLDPPSQLAVR